MFLKTGNNLGDDNFTFAFMFANEQVIISNNEDMLNWALYELHNTGIKYNFKICINHTN
jgi:hypothetical protein